MKGWWLSALIAGLAWAQTPAAQPPAPGSISGTVRDAATNLPIPDVRVFAGPKNAVTDTNGHYALREIPPGTVRVAIAPDFRKNLPAASRVLNLAPGQDLASVDLVLRPFGEITGKIVDQNGEPVPGASVNLVARQYWLGSMHYNLINGAAADDQGRYVLQRIEPGRAFLLVAQKRESKLEGISNSPANPKLRRPAWVPTYFPGISSIDGAQAITLSPGERREGMDFQMLRSPSYCVSGVVQAPLGGGRVHFSISEAQPTFGTTGEGGTYGMLPNGDLESDGKFRLCNLHPGQYELEVHTEERGLDGPEFYSKLPLTITDEDLDGISTLPAPRVPIAVEAAWDGTPPNSTANTAAQTRGMQAGLESLTRTERLIGTVSIPGKVSLMDAALDDYHIIVNGGLNGNAYIEDITYGAESVLHKTVRPGSAPGDPALKIVVSPNGGRIAAAVADKDGNPLPDAMVAAFPEKASTEILLADAVVSGRTDQTGAWTSPALAPGKYEVLALDLPAGVNLDRSPETLAKLLRARGKAQEIELPPAATAPATLSITPLD